MLYSNLKTFHSVMETAWCKVVIAHYFFLSINGLMACEKMLFLSLLGQAETTLCPFSFFDFKWETSLMWRWVKSFMIPKDKIPWCPWALFLDVRPRYSKVCTLTTSTTGHLGRGWLSMHHCSKVGTCMPNHRHQKSDPSLPFHPRI